MQNIFGIITKPCLGSVIIFFNQALKNLGN